MRPLAKSEAGFTLVEMMIAVLVTAVIIAAALTTAVSTNRATIVNSQVADTQQNARLGSDLISRDIKLAGYNYNPLDPATNAVGNCRSTIGAIVKPVGLLPQDQTLAGADSGPDGVSMVVPFANTTPWTLTASVGGTKDYPQSFNAISLSAAAISEMDQPSGSLVGRTISIGGAVSRTVVTKNATSIGFGTNSVEAMFPIGAPVYLMECVQYQVMLNNPATCGSTAPCLVRNGVPIVDGVEDLQITYACDGCNIVAPNPPQPDGIIDNQDGSSSSGLPTYTQGDFISNNSWAIAPWTPDKIKMAQVNIVARQTQGDVGLDEQGTRARNTGGPIVVGDHDPSTDATYSAVPYQQFRRRLLTRTIQPRNL